MSSTDYTPEKSQWLARFVVRVEALLNLTGARRRFVQMIRKWNKGQLPSKSRKSLAPSPLPLEHGRILSMEEKYAIVAAIHDSGAKGQSPIFPLSSLAPRPDTDNHNERFKDWVNKYGAYHELLRRASGKLNEDDQPYIDSFLEGVEVDLRTNLPGRMPSPEDQEICDFLVSIAGGVARLLSLPGAQEVWRKKVTGWCEAVYEVDAGRVPDGRFQENILPLGTHELSLDEKYVLLAAIHDDFTRAREPIIAEAFPNERFETVRNDVWLECNRPAKICKKDFEKIRMYLADIERKLGGGGADEQAARNASKQVPWDEGLTDYQPLSQVCKQLSRGLTLSALSRFLKPDGLIRFMRKPGQRCRVHVGDLVAYLESVDLKDGAVKLIEKAYKDGLREGKTH